LKVEEENNIWVNSLNIQIPNSIVLMNFISPQMLNKIQAMPPQTSNQPIDKYFQTFKFQNVEISK
jgi:hypothetical protein